MIRFFILLITGLMLFTQCQNSTSKTQLSDSVSTMSRDTQDSDTTALTKAIFKEVAFKPYHQSNPDFADLSKKAIGNQPKEVWETVQKNKSGRQTLLYRFKNYDVWVDEQDEGDEIAVYQTLKSRPDEKNTRRLIVSIPEKADFILSDKDRQKTSGFFYFTGISKNYLFLDDGTDVCRNFHIYQLGTFEKIYTLDSCEPINLINEHELEFYEDTKLPADSANCYPHIPDDEKSAYKEYPNQFVITEENILDLRTKRIRKTGELKCVYRQ